MGSPAMNDAQFAATNELSLKTRWAR
jgi:hypothetical protein